MARFIADEIIPLRREPSDRAAEDGTRPICDRKRPILSRSGLEAACTVFLGKLKKIEKNKFLIAYKKMAPHDKMAMERSMEAALKAYLRIARKNAE